MSICWMCQKNEADTGEHIFKNTILREMYGKDKFSKGNRLIFRKENSYSGKVSESKRTIESTNSDFFKFIDTLCRTCNGSLSQNWDDQFDVFIKFLLKNYDSCLKSGCVNLRYLNSYFSSKELRELYSYFCKLFGCLLVSNKIPVPLGILSVVHGGSYMNELGINIVYNENLSNVQSPSDFLYCGDLEGMNGNEQNFIWQLGFGPITICFWYKTPKEYTMGKQWFGRSYIVPFVRFI